MFDKYKSVLDVKLGTKFLEHLIVELLTVVNNNNVGKSESTNNGLLKEILDLTLDNVH